MLRTTLASSRNLRACVLGLVTFTTAIIITSDNAEARRYRHRHYARHHVTHVARESYSPQFASIVVDGNSGATLSSNNPDGIRRPASLTKIMTLYLLFERLDAGKMKLDTEMDVSERASEQAPTKLGLRPGQTIRVEDAIKGLVTRSANDAAVVIAETIGGDEDDFARLMTRKDRARSSDAGPRHPGAVSALLSLLLDDGIQLSRPVDPQPQSPAGQRGRRRR